MSSDRTPLRDPDNPFRDVIGEKLASKSAWVAYQGCNISGKGSREDAYFTGQMPNSVLKTIENKPSDIQQKLIEEAIARTVDKLQNECAEKNGGTTLVVSLKVGDKIYIANVGDSIACTYDKKTNSISEPVITYHDASNEKEEERVKKAGGWIWGGRVMNEAERGGLLVTRSIGPYSISQEDKERYARIPLTQRHKGLIHDSSINVMPAMEGQLILLSSDGFEKEIEKGKTALDMLRESPEKDLKKNVTNLMKEYRNVLKTTDDVAIMVVDPKPGAIYGICDGHGGRGSAYTVSNEFSNIFNQELKNGLQLAASQERESVEVVEKKQKWADPRLSKVDDFITSLPKWYSKLHRFSGKHKDDLTTLVNTTKEFLSAENQSEETKLNQVFKYIEQQIRKAMHKTTGVKDINDLVVHLNENLGDHHQLRLLTILYDGLSKSGLKSKYDNMEIDSKTTISIKRTGFSPNLFSGRKDDIYENACEIARIHLPDRAPSFKKE